MALVVKRWYADVRPNEHGMYAEILARKSGVIAWLFSLVGIDPTYLLAVYLDKIAFQTASWGGYQKTIIPMGSVSAMHYGYRKPWMSALAIVVGASYVGWYTTQWISLVGLVVAVIHYALHKDLEVGVFLDSGDKVVMPSLRRSVIEGQAISETQLEYITRIVTTLHDHQKARPTALVGESQIAPMP